MQVIVTGASGFIGRNVLLGAPRDWSIVAVSRRAPQLDAFVRSHDLAHVECVGGDVTSADDVRRIAARVGGGVDAVLYLAANGDPGASAERPAWDLASNALGLVTFLEHVRADHFVFVSSGAVYDGLAGEVTPATALAPRLPYAIAKLTAEHYVRFFTERRKTLGGYVNVRFFGAYGPYEPERKITTRWIRTVLDRGAEFAVRGDGGNLVDFMHVDDAVSGLVAVVKARGARATIDFGAGAPLTVDEVTAAMARVTGGNVTVVHRGHTEEYIRFRTVDTAMRTAFGFTPRIDFADGFARLYRALREPKSAAR